MICSVRAMLNKSSKADNLFLPIRIAMPVGAVRIVELREGVGKLNSNEVNPPAIGYSMTKTRLKKY
jgi:hypothetical protein